MRKLERLGSVRRRSDRGSTWFIDLGRTARRRRIYSWKGERFRTKGVAEAALLQIRKSVAEGLSLDDAVGLILGDGAAENSVGARIERWMELRRQECEAGDLSPSYLRELERWFGPRGHVGAYWRDRPVTALDLAGVRDWAAWLNRRRGRSRVDSPEPHLLSAKTRKNVHGALHAFVAWIAEEDRRVKLPSRWPWPAKGAEADVQIISIETQEAILERVPEDKRGAFLALAHLGIRPGEAIALDVGDYRDGWITVSKARKGEQQGAPIRGTKSGKVKRLPCTDELRGWIERHHGKRSMLAGGPLFPNPDAKQSDLRWTSAALRDNWRRACRDVGVKVGLYAGTKHATATYLLAQGVQERAIQALLGHSDARSTRRYAKLGDQAVVEAVRVRRPREAE